MSLTLQTGSRGKMEYETKDPKHFHDQWLDLMLMVTFVQGKAGDFLDKVTEKAKDMAAEHQLNKNHVE